MEPPLKEIAAEGRLNQEVFNRIGRRVDYLVAEIRRAFGDNEIPLSGPSKAQPPAPAGTVLMLDSSYWSTLIQKIESAATMTSGSDVTEGTAGEPRLRVPTPPFRIHRAALNRIIRRIETLATYWGGSGTGINT